MILRHGFLEEGPRGYGKEEHRGTNLHGVWPKRPQIGVAPVRGG